MRDGLRRRAIAVLAASMASTAAQRADASPSARLVYARGASAETCASEIELRKAVAARLGYDPFFPHADKTVIAEIDRDSDGFRGIVRIVDDQGTVRGARTLRAKGDDCGPVLAALALALSISLDDLDSEPPNDPASEPPAPPPSPPPSEPEHAPEAPSSASVRALEPEKSQERLRGMVSLGPVLGLGTGPGPALGGSLSAALRVRWFGARLDLRGELPVSTSLEGNGGELRTQTTLGTMAGCAYASIFFGCVGVGVGRIGSTTRGLARGAEDAAMLVVASARPGITIPLGSWLYAEGSVEIGPNLTRHRVEVDGATAYRLPPLFGVAVLHMGLHFPK